MNHHKPIAILYCFAIALILSIRVSAQSNIYTENFNYPDGTTSASQWTLDVSQCNTAGINYHFQVLTQQFEGRNLGGEAVWYSSIIPISGYQGVSASVGVSRAGIMSSSDYVKVSYILNGGAETLFATNGSSTGNFAATIAQQTGLVGSTLQIVVRAYNSGGSKRHKFDNISVTGISTVTTPITVVSNTTPATCSGHADGNMVLTVAGGTPPYAYLWNSGGTVTNLTGAPSGTYSVTITDAVGATATAVDSIGQLQPMTLTLNERDASPNGNDGFAKATVTGGAPSYTFAWDNGINQANNYYLSPGTYNLTVTDSNLCTATALVTINTANNNTLFYEDFDGLASADWNSVSFVGNYTNYWIIQNSPCSVDNYSLQITDSSNICTYDKTVTQDILTFTTINAVGYDSLVLSFNWRNVGETNFDFGSVWYSVDSVNWNMLTTGGNGNGAYENSANISYQTIALPDSLKNRTFCIGFNWNNDASAGSNPAFSVDDIAITGLPYSPPVPNAAPTCTWTGTSSIFWTDLLNWDCNHQPLPTDNVIIASATPFIPNIVKPLNAYCNNLLVQPNAGLIITSGAALEVHGDFTSQSTLPFFGGTVIFKGDSNQHIQWPDSSKFYDLVINNHSVDSGVVLLNNIKVANTLALAKGYIVTNADTVIMLNSYPFGQAIHSYSDSSHVVGNLRRYITPNYFAYDFPVGNMGDSSLYNATLLPDNLLGVNYVTASFHPIYNSLNSQVSASDSGINYNKISHEGLWQIDPDNAPTGGAYNVRLGIPNIHYLQDNTFGILKRPIGTNGSYWSTGNGSIPALFMPGRTVSSGFAERDGLPSFCEFAIARYDSISTGNFWVGSFHSSNQVVINWHDTIFGANAQLQKSTDGVHFVNVTNFTFTSQGSSNRMTDNNPDKGLVFYRVEAVNASGKKQHSTTLAINCIGFADDLLTVYPNPNQGLVNIRLETKEPNVDVVISNINGEILYTYSAANEGSLFEKTVDLKGITSSGTYFVRVITPTETFIRKISVVK